VKTCRSPQGGGWIHWNLRVLPITGGPFLGKEFKAKAMTVPPSYPLQMSYETKGTLGDVSLRHAAIAAGLGNFGRHNLVIHPKIGTRVALYSCDDEFGPFL